MAVNPYMGWVNMQMVSVRHHLALLVEPQNVNERLKNQGVLESAAWQLARAYRFYLYEIGANYHIAAPEKYHTAHQVAEALEAIGKHPGEATELVQLSENGWVSELLFSVSESETSLSSSTSVSKTVNANQLAILDLDKNRSSISKEVISDYLDKFKELIDRQREVMQEY